MRSLDDDRPKVPWQAQAIDVDDVASSNNDAIGKVSEVRTFFKAKGLHYDGLLRLVAPPVANSFGSLKIMHSDESSDLVRSASIDWMRGRWTDCILVENTARRQHRAFDLLHDIEGMKLRG